MSDALTALVRAARRRRILVAAAAAAARGLAAGAILLLAAALWHRFVTELPALGAASLLLAPIALALYASWRARPTFPQSADAIDRRFDTRSLLASAWATPSNTANPTARLVLADAQACASTLRARLMAAFPLTLPRSAAPSAALAIAAVFLLVQPGAPAAGRTASAPQPSATSERRAAPDGRMHETHAHSVARDPGAANADADPDATDAAANDVPGAPRGGAARAALAAGDKPGRARAALGTADRRATPLATRWVDRARSPEGSAGTDATGSASDADGAAHDAPLPATALPAADAAQIPYEPALAPALAAYVRAVARAEQGR